MKGLKTKYEYRKRVDFTPWWHFIVAINLFFIVITTVNLSLPDFPQRWRLFFPFELNREMNIATWWSGICLFTLSFIAYEFFCTKKDGSQKAWMSLSLLLLGLSFDEISSVHERIGSWSNLLPFGIVCVALLTYSLYGLIQRNDTRKSALFILSGFILFCTVAFQEYLEENINWSSWTLGIRIGLEEGSELLGTFMIFCGIIKQRQYIKPRSFKILIPKPHLTKYLKIILFIGMILNSIVCIIVIPNLHDLKGRGNPALWYPTVVNFVLFSVSFWKNSNSSTNNRKTWIFLSAFFVLCSVSIMFNFSVFLPGIIKKIIPPFLYYYLLYICQLSIIVFFYIKKYNLLPKKNLFFIALLVLLLFLGFIVEDIVRQLLILGLFTFIFAKIFLNNYLLFE